MKELSVDYRISAAAIHGRLAELRAMEKASADPEEAFRLRRRMAELTPLWREAKALAELTEHYYERSYYRDAHYTL